MRRKPSAPRPDLWTYQNDNESSSRALHPVTVDGHAAVLTDGNGRVSVSWRSRRNTGGCGERSQVASTATLGGWGELTSQPESLCVTITVTSHAIARERFARYSSCAGPSYALTLP